MKCKLKCETKHFSDGRSPFSGQITLFNLKFISQNTDKFVFCEMKTAHFVSFRFAKYSKPINNPCSKSKNIH